MATFEPSDESYDEAFDRAMSAKAINDEGEEIHFHQDLIDTKARILTMFASPNVDEYGEKKGPALTKAGNKVLWKVKVKNLEHRTAYKVDAEFVIDKEAWEAWTPDERYAAVDEMLYSLQVQRDKDNFIKSDDLGHPVLKIRKPDIVIETYKKIVERHKAECEGYKAIKTFAQFHDQLLMDWAKEVADDEVAKNTTVTVRKHVPAEEEDAPTVRMMDRPDAADRHKSAKPKKEPAERAAAKTKPRAKKGEARP